VVQIRKARDGRIVSERDSHGIGLRDRALTRIMGEIDAGLRHGYFEYTLTCEVVGHERRRLVLRAGKSYQFVLAKEDCEPTNGSGTIDSCDGSDHDDV
jgi:DNA-binding transcriptional LysR family regulator